jgi:hypothetical protein
MSFSANSDPRQYTMKVEGIAFMTTRKGLKFPIIAHGETESGSSIAIILLKFITILFSYPFIRAEVFRVPGPPTYAIFL